MLLTSIHIEQGDSILRDNELTAVLSRLINTSNEEGILTSHVSR